MLADDGVDLGCVVRTAEPTTLALASLDAIGAASWSFYTTGTAAAGLTPQDALAALPAQVAALHVGTLGLVLEPLATALEAVVQRLAGETMVVVDPNCRPQVIDDPQTFRARLERVLAFADLVKVSEEDLAWLDPGRSRPAAARDLLERGPRAVLLTRGPDGATVITAGADTPIAPVPTEVVDTIGAGDAFGGAFLAWWTRTASGGRTSRRTRSSWRPRSSPRSSRRGRWRRPARRRPGCWRRPRAARSGWRACRARFAVPGARACELHRCRRVGPIGRASRITCGGSWRPYERCGSERPHTAPG